MTPEQFCYWLNGFGELSTEPPTAEQWVAIKQHLESVFVKVTPIAPGSISSSDQAHGLQKALERARKEDEARRVWGGAVFQPRTGLPVVTC